MIVNLVLIGLAVTLDPLPLTAFFVVLPSERGARKGAAFAFGWLASLAIVVTITVLATGNNPPKPSTAPSLAALAAKIALGAVLVVIAVRHIRASGQPKPPKKPPKWQRHVDNMSPWFAMALAPTLQPWVLIGAGAATVVQAKLSSWASCPMMRRSPGSGWSSLGRSGSSSPRCWCCAKAGHGQAGHVALDGMKLAANAPKVGEPDGGSPGRSGGGCGRNACGGQCRQR